MVLDKTLATANLALQVLLVILVAWAAYIAKKKMLMKHCTVMRILVPVQIIALIGVMLPSLLRYAGKPPFFYSEILAHHSLGLLIVALWLYINLVFGKPYMPKNLALIMRLAFALWILAFLLGVRLYVLIYT